MKIRFPGQNGFSTQLVAAALAAFLTGLTPGGGNTAQAANYTWDPAGDGSGSGGAGAWNTTATNWYNGSPAQPWADTTGANDIAVFGGTGGAVTLGAVGALGVQFLSSGYTLSSGTLTLGANGFDGSALASGTVAISSPIILAAGQAWNFGAGSTLAASGPISGANSLNINGAGTVAFSGTNTFTGGLTLSQGTLAISGSFANNALGGSLSGTNGAVSINGGTLQVQLNNASTAITNTHVLTIGSNGGTIKILPPSSTGVTPSYIMGAAGNLTGSGTLTVNGNGTLGTAASLNSVLVMGNANAGFTGNVVLQSGAILEDNNVNAIASTGTFIVNNLGVLSANSVNIAQAVKLNDGGSLAFQNNNNGVFSGPIALSGSTNVRLQDWWSATLRNGTITNNMSGDGSLNVAPGGVIGGTLTLTGTSTYTGSTTIGATTLAIGGAGLLGNGSYAGNIGNAGTFNYNSTANQALSGVISGTGALTKANSGILTLSGSNTFSGVTSINAGALKFAGTSAMSASSTVNTASGGTLLVNVDGSGEFTSSGSGAGTVAGLFAGVGGQGSAVTLPAGSSLGIDTTNASGPVVLSAWGNANNPGLLKMGSGTLQLNSSATYAGNGGPGFPFVVRQGTVLISNGTHTLSGETVIGGTFGTAAGATGYDAKLQVDGGTVNISSWLSVGRGNGTGSVSSDLVLNNSAVMTAANYSGGFNAGGALNLVKATTTLNGNSSLSVNANGEFHLAESPGANVTMTLNDFSTVNLLGNPGADDRRYIGNAGTVGTLIINGTASFIDSATRFLDVGLASGTGTITLNSGTFSHAGGEIRIATTTANGSFNSVGTINVNGGTFTAGALTLARNNNNVASNLNATMNVTGGTVNVNNGGTLIGWQGGGSTGTINISGGTFNQGMTALANIDIGTFGNVIGTLNVSGSGNLAMMRNGTIRFSTNTSSSGTNAMNVNGGNVTFYSDAGSTVGGTGVIDLMNSAANSAANNSLNLNGGTVTVNAVKATSANGTSAITFNGGTLQAASGTNAFVSGLTAAKVRNSGAIIDSNGFDVTIPQVLAHSNIGGDNATDGGLTKRGNGTLTLAGNNTYTGATTINSGTLSVAVITNGGVASNLGQASSDASKLVFNGGALLYTGASASTDRGFTVNAGNSATWNIANALTLSGSSAATTGGLTKAGAGTLTLTGVHGYTGNTNVNAGTLALGGAGSLATGAITVNGSGAKFLQTSSAAVSAPITLTQGTVDGTGSLGAVTVASAATNVLAHGNGTTATLTLGSLTFNGDAAVHELLSGTSAPIMVSGALTTTGANGWVTFNLSTTTGLWADNTTYNLLSYGSFSGSFTDFGQNFITPLAGRQIATLGDSGSAITLSITGDTPIWTGAANGNWSTTAQGAPYNWVLQTSGSSTEFQANDKVLFNDTATGTTDIEISDADVTTVSFAFNNSAKDYTINSAAGFGISSGFLTKDGTGKVTLNTANTYTGPTTINNGVLQLGNANAVQNSTVTVNAANALAFSGGIGSFNLGALAGSGNVDLTDAASAGVTLVAGANGASTTYSGILSGAGALTKSGTGTLTLTGSNSYTGATTINAGTLQIGDGVTDGSIATSSGIANSGTLVYNLVGSQTFGNIISGTGALIKTGSGNLTLTGVNTYSGATTIASGTLQVGDGVTDGSIASTSSVTDNGALVYNLVGSSTLGATVSGVGSLTKNGAGILTMTGTDNHTGGTTINDGTLEFDVIGNGATGVININNGGRLQTNIAAPNWGYNPTINLGADGYFSNVGAGPVNYSGVLNGNGHALNVNSGVARLYINSTTTNISQFNVTSGAMGFDLNVGNQGGGAPVFVSNGASLYLANTTNTLTNNVTLSGAGLGGVGALYYEGAGTANVTGTFTMTGDTSFGGNSATGYVKLNGPIIGTGALTKIGANLYSLSGSNSYTGPTNINGGTLGIASTGGTNANLGAGDVTVNSGGILRLGYAMTSNTNQSVTANNVTLAGGSIYADDAFQHLSGNINVTAGSTLGSTFNSGNNTAAEQNKGLALDGVVSGNGALTIQHTRFDTTHAWDASFVAFNNNSNTYTGSVTVNENTTAAEGGVYLGVNASNALQHSTVTVSPIPTTGGVGRFGASPIVFNTGLGSATLGAIAGSANLVLTGYDEINHAQGSDAIALTVGGNGDSTSYTGVVSGVGSLAKAGSGVFTMSANNTYTGATSVNGGTLVLSGSLSATSSVNVASGATLQVDGLVKLAATTNVAGTLCGSGQLGAITASAGATIAPGSATTTAILSGTGAITLGDGLGVAHLAMKIGSTTAGTGYDQFKLLAGSSLNLSNAHLDGSLLNNYTPAAFATWDTQGTMLTTGDTFYLVIGVGTRTGEFANQLAATSYSNGMNLVNFGGQEFVISYSANYNGGVSSSFFSGGNDIALMAVPEPTTWAMMISGLGMLGFFQRMRRRNG